MSDRLLFYDKYYEVIEGQYNVFLVDGYAFNSMDEAIPVECVKLSVMDVNKEIKNKRLTIDHTVHIENPIDVDGAVITDKNRLVAYYQMSSRVHIDKNSIHIEANIHGQER